MTGHLRTHVTVKHHINLPGVPVWFESLVLAVTGSFFLENTVTA